MSRSSENQKRQAIDIKKSYSKSEIGSPVRESDRESDSDSSSYRSPEMLSDELEGLE